MVSLLLRLGKRLPLCFRCIRARARSDNGLLATSEAAGHQAARTCGYVDFMSMVMGSAYALTDSEDSGGGHASGIRASRYAKTPSGRSR